MSNPVSLNDKQTEQANLAFNKLVFEPLKNHEVVCKTSDSAELVSWDVDKEKETAQTRFLFVGGEKEKGGIIDRESDRLIYTAGIGLHTVSVHRFAMELDKEAIKAFIQKYCPSST